MEDEKSEGQYCINAAYWKQGDDVRDYLKFHKGNAKKALNI